MIPRTQIAVNVINAYIEKMEKQFVNPSELTDSYIHVLRVREWQLLCRLNDLPQTLASRAILLDAHREAEQFLLTIDSSDRKDVIAEISNILNLIAIEFFADIKDIEGQHPSMRADFDMEQENYRIRWNAHAPEVNNQRSPSIKPKPN